jgi:ribosome-binding protein aMBF1 (putative translation factor)
MTPDQCRAARALLDWRQDTLAERARAGVTTIRNFENGKIFAASGDARRDPAGARSGRRRIHERR